MPYTLPKPPYAYDALEPHIDAKTMEIHHTKHHQTYIDNVNKAIGGTSFDGKPIEELIRNLKNVPPEKQSAIRNHGGGHYNHSLFWTILGPGGGGKPSGTLSEALTKAFASFEGFQEKFEAAAKNQFGSGWAWLVVDPSTSLGAGGGAVAVLSTPNQDSPLSEGKIPILGVDVWEHAYYLKYQNKRPDYLKAFWNVVNWTEVERRFGEAV